jgi:hypothetical protein
MTKKTKHNNNEVTNWIASHLPTINIILLLLAIGISVFPFGNLDSELNEAMIKVITLLVIIATSFFITNSGYLERITKSVTRFDKFAEQMEKIKYSKMPCDYNKMILQATNSIFFSGNGMSHFEQSLAKALAEIAPHVEINCVVSDLSGDAIETINFLTGLSKSDPSIITDHLNRYNKHLDTIRAKRGINNAFIKIVSMISYFAIDYKQQTESSFIQAKHILLSDRKGDYNTFYCIARPGTEIYEYYRNQIEILEKKAMEINGASTTT